MSSVSALPQPAAAQKPGKKSPATVRLPHGLWMQFRFHAFMSGVSAADLAETVLTEYLERAGYPASEIASK